MPSCANSAKWPRKSDRRPLFRHHSTEFPVEEWFDIHLWARGHQAGGMSYGKFRINDGPVRWRDYGPRANKAVAHIETLDHALGMLLPLLTRTQSRTGVRVFNDYHPLLRWVDFTHNEFLTPKVRMLYCWRYWENKPGFRWRRTMQKRGDRPEFSKLTTPEYRTKVLQVLDELRLYGGVQAMRTTRSLLAVRLKY